MLKHWEEGKQLGFYFSLRMLFSATGKKSANCVPFDKCLVLQPAGTSNSFFNAMTVSFTSYIPLCKSGCKVKAWFTVATQRHKEKISFTFMFLCSCCYVANMSSCLHALTTNITSFYVKIRLAIESSEIKTCELKTCLWAKEQQLQKV